MPCNPGRLQSDDGLEVVGIFQLLLYYTHFDQSVIDQLNHSLLVFLKPPLSSPPMNTCQKKTL